MITGVAGGLAEYMDVDPVFVRTAWVILFFCTLGLALVLYIALAFIMPREENAIK